MKAREHLKYWRFVKEFHEVDERSIRVTVSIGKDLCPKKWKEYCELGMNLMNSAVKQYEGEFVSTMLEDVLAPILLRLLSVRQSFFLRLSNRIFLDRLEIRHLLF
jgi:hypothetical protein